MTACASVRPEPCRRFLRRRFSADPMLIEDPWGLLRALTSARIALGRAGSGLPTRALLDFQLAHARARDAVHRELDISQFRLLDPLDLKSAAPDRATYLQRPDLGRRLAPSSA